MGIHRHGRVTCKYSQIMLKNASHTPPGYYDPAALTAYNLIGIMLYSPPGSKQPSCSLKWLPALNNSSLSIPEQFNGPIDGEIQ